MSESPGWLIVCYKCGQGEMEGFDLEPEPLAKWNRAAPTPVRAYHVRWERIIKSDGDDDWDMYEECPTPKSC